MDYFQAIPSWSEEVRTTLKLHFRTAHYDAWTASWVILIMADLVEETEEEEDDSVLTCNFKKPLELFEERKIVRICAPMVRYSK